MPENYPKINKLHLEHGESLKIRFWDFIYVNAVMVGLPFAVAIHLPQKLRGDEKAYSPGLVSSQCSLMAAIKDIALLCKINSYYAEGTTTFMKLHVKL